MPQLINKKKIYFYLFLLFLLTTISNINIISKVSSIFLIKKIEVKTSQEYFNEIINSDINYLKNKNIFLFNSKDILSRLFELKLFDSITIKKKLPSTIIINVKETDLIAIAYINQKKYFVGKNGKFIEFKKIQTEEKLPIIFGDFEINNFIFLKNLLSKNNMKLEKINKFFFHKNKRWDLFYENNILIQLPEKNIEKSLKIYNKFVSRNSIKPNSIIDLRISNRIIFKNE